MIQPNSIVIVSSRAMVDLEGITDVNLGGIPVNSRTSLGGLPVKIGIDMVDMDRLRRVMDKTTLFTGRTFSERELTVSESLPPARRLSFLAGRFAVKEAVLKALGTGISGGIALTDIETLPLASGKPELYLSGQALCVATDLGIQEFQVSVSHEGGFAIGMVVLA